MPIHILISKVEFDQNPFTIAMTHPTVKLRLVPYQPFFRLQNVISKKDEKIDQLQDRVMELVDRVLQDRDKEREQKFVKKMEDLTAWQV